MFAFAQSVTWQILPFPTNSNWPGPQGEPAVTNGNTVTLDGQPVRTVQTFTPPVTISYDMSLDARSTSDGYLALYFMPPGQGTGNPDPATVAFTIYRNDGQDALRIDQDAPSGNTTVWGEVPFSVSAETNYHVVMTVSSGGQLTWSINGEAYSITSNVTVPFNPFQLEVESWQPGDIWQVSNFTVTTAPVITCPNIIGTWTGQVAVADSQRGYSETTLSLQVSDQNTNSCLLRGYLNTGTAHNRMPWGCFSPGGLWGNVPFTGTILDTTGVVLNLGMFGQASATLDMTQTPPVMNTFILLSTGGAANGDTAVGDLTEMPSSP